MKIRDITITSMLIAINVVLSYAAPIKLGNFKFTFEAFPILVGAILYGPICGLTVGTIGPFIYQAFSEYGLMLTTPLWILPHTLSGLIVGLYSKYHNYKMNNIQLIFITLLSSLIVTALNTLAIYCDAKINGYYTFAYVFSNIYIKIITGIILSIINAFIINKLMKTVSKL